MLPLHCIDIQDLISKITKSFSNRFDKMDEAYAKRKKYEDKQQKEWLQTMEKYRTDIKSVEKKLTDKLKSIKKKSKRTKRRTTRRTTKRTTRKKMDIDFDDDNDNDENDNNEDDNDDEDNDIIINNKTLPPQYFKAMNFILITMNGNNNNNDNDNDQILNEMIQKHGGTMRTSFKKRGINNNYFLIISSQWFKQLTSGETKKKKIGLFMNLLQEINNKLPVINSSNSRLNAFTRILKQLQQRNIIILSSNFIKNSIDNNQLLQITKYFINVTTFFNNINQYITQQIKKINDKVRKSTAKIIIIIGINHNATKSQDKLEVCTLMTNGGTLRKVFPHSFTEPMSLLNVNEIIKDWRQQFIHYIDELNKLYHEQQKQKKILKQEEQKRKKEEEQTRKKEEEKKKQLHPPTAPKFSNNLPNLNGRSKLEPINPNYHGTCGDVLGRAILYITRNKWYAALNKKRILWWIRHLGIREKIYDNGIQKMIRELNKMLPFPLQTVNYGRGTTYYWKISKNSRNILSTIYKITGVLENQDPIKTWDKDPADIDDKPSNKDFSSSSNEELVNIQSNPKPTTTTKESIIPMNIGNNDHQDTIRPITEAITNNKKRRYEESIINNSPPPKKKIKLS